MKKEWIIFFVVCFGLFPLAFFALHPIIRWEKSEREWSEKVDSVMTRPEPIYVETKSYAYPESYSHGDDAQHPWELIGDDGNCKLFYRKHKQNRLYWSLCKNGISTIAVK